MDVLGDEAKSSMAAPYQLSRLQSLFLFTRSDTIYGGSNEIQRNIIAERAWGCRGRPADDAIAASECPHCRNRTAACRASTLWTAAAMPIAVSDRMSDVACEGPPTSSVVTAAIAATMTRAV